MTNLSIDEAIETLTSKHTEFGTDLCDDSEWRKLTPAVNMAIEALKYMKNVDENYKKQKLLYQKEYQDKVQKCIERIESIKPKEKKVSDYEFGSIGYAFDNGCIFAHDKIIEIINEEMGCGE